jgi:hypothetical protein
MNIPEGSLFDTLEMFTGFIGGLLGGLLSSIFYLRFIKSREVKIEKIEEVKINHFWKIKVQVLLPLLLLFRNKWEILSCRYEDLTCRNEMNDILFNDLYNHFPELVENIKQLLSIGQILCSLTESFDNFATSFLENLPQEELRNASKKIMRENISRINPLSNTPDDILVLTPFYDELLRLRSRIMESPRMKDIVAKIKVKKDKYEKIRREIIEDIDIIIETSKLPGKCKFIEL